MSILRKISDKAQLDIKLASIQSAVEFWRKFLSETKFTTKDYVVVLLSDQEEVNRYTLKCLPALKAEKKLNRIFVFIYDRDVEEITASVTIPVEIRVCEKPDIDNLAKLYSVHNFSSQISFNSFQKTADNDGFRLLQSGTIRMQDIVSVAVLGLEDVPQENVEISQENANTGYKPIDWNTEQYGIMLSSEFDTIEERIKKGINALLSRHCIQKEDQIVLFGATTASMQIIDQLEGWHIDAIVDNNQSKQGTMIRGIRVYSPEEYLGNYRRELKILVASQYYRQMCEQIYYLGYELGRQVFVVFGEKNKWDVSGSTLRYLEDSARQGFSTYCDIRNRYPQETIMVCPYSGTGDIYLIGLYREELEKHQKVIYIVCSDACARIADMFGMPAEVISHEDMRAFVRTLRILGLENTRAKILNDCFYQLSIARMRGYKGIDFHTMFAACVFSVDTRKPNIPEVTQKSSDEIFKHCQLQPKKTVLISPYANTVSKVPVSVWEEIIGQLQAEGLDVCTNISAPEEAALPGTKGVFIPYNQIIDFLDKAGHFIGLRSGLCDIISTTKATVSILYPEGKVFTNCTTYEYFSLEKMGFRNDRLLELVYTEQEREKHISLIVDFIKKNIGC